MNRARLFLTWVLSFALLANVLSPRAAVADFSPDLAICHSAEGGAVRLPAPEDAACRQHCMTLAAAMLTPDPPHFAVARVWRRAEQTSRAPDAPSLAPRHADAQPRAPPASGA